MSIDRGQANQEALDRIIGADPVLVDVRVAGDLPGMKPNTILTSGAPLPWDRYVGLQRKAILHGALYEGLAGSVEEAARKIEAGEIILDSTMRLGCAGVHAGIYTASTPVFVVEDGSSGAVGYCHMFEGDTPRRLGFGFYGPDVVASLKFIDEVVAPTMREVVRRTGPIPLHPIARRALQYGDELHARCSASMLLFTRAILPALLDLARERDEAVRKTLKFFETAEHFFYRIWMAASKATCDAATGVEGSSVVTALCFNCQDFAIRVSGLGDEWFRGPHPRLDGRFLEGAWVAQPAGNFTSGSDCMFSECMGLGAFASAAAFMVQGYQGVRPQAMVERTLEMYKITVGEHPGFQIPFLDNRGVPLGIDIFKVVESGVLPHIEGIIVNPDGTVRGSGVVKPPMECFQAAVRAYRDRYG